MPADGEPVIVYTAALAGGIPARAAGRGPCQGGRYASGSEPHTTNQRMEIRAALEALRALTPTARAIVW